MALLAVFSKSEEKSVSLATNRVPTAIVAAPILIGVVALAIFGTRAVMAEVTYKKSLDALGSNNAKDTYTLMAQAITQSPYVDRYHASLAQVEMAIASSIANNKDLTEEDRQTAINRIKEIKDKLKKKI